ncbi:hypothetical protein EJB05_18551, partial [Eragrostis curvula]
METRRVSIGRRLSCPRRVLARQRRRLDASANSARKLQRREIAAGPSCAFAAGFTRERFRNIQLQTESLELPGFVEFDDVNDKVLTYSAENSPGKMLLEYPKVGGYIPLEILSIEDGKRLMSFKHLLHPNKKVDFIEQFNEKLLIKQEGENLQILDLRDFKLAEVSKAEFVSPLAFIFLYERQLFLAFDFRSVEILTGKCLAKIKGGDLCKQKKASMFQSSPSEALRDITALYYDEERDEIYTGNGQGLVHVWSS